MGKRNNNDILDELLRGFDWPEDRLGEGGLMKDLKKACMQRMPGAKLTDQLGYEHGDQAPPAHGNRRKASARFWVSGSPTMKAPSSGSP